MQTLLSAFQDDQDEELKQEASVSKKIFKRFIFTLSGWNFILLAIIKIIILLILN